LDSNLLAVEQSTCPPFGTIDTLYVAASNFTPPIVDVEYRIETYGHFGLLLDLVPVGYSIEGYSGTGIRVSFGGPLDASGKILVESVVGGWFCDCSEPIFPYITVQPHPDSGKIQATAWPDLIKVDAMGGFCVLCGTLPVESSTWGQIKALYR
jgi:hypothetical protein